jgi:phosphopantothenoylcysteine synthetase/decarboxylase
MGYELASALARKGHTVLLVSGPTTLDVPDHLDFLPVETAAEMYEAVERHLGRMDIAVFVAAVADYTPATVPTQKIKKSGGSFMLELVSTRDILGSARYPLGFTGTLVGFAAETECLEAHAREKLTGKHCDLVIANDVSKSGRGFDSDDNEVMLVYPDHSTALPPATKHELAHQLADAIFELHAMRVARVGDASSS